MNHEHLEEYNDKVYTNKTIMKNSAKNSINVHITFQNTTQLSSILGVNLKEKNKDQIFNFRYKFTRFINACLSDLYTYNIDGILGLISERHHINYKQMKIEQFHGIFTNQFR